MSVVEGEDLTVLRVDLGGGRARDFVSTLGAPVTFVGSMCGLGAIWVSAFGVVALVV